MNSYGSKDIVVLEGLDAVRLRPGMYIGSTGSRGVHHILWEIVDNSMDEVANGHGGKIVVTLYGDGSVSVEDDGRGIPVDMHPTLKKSGAEVIFTQLHAGGKFNNSNYSYSGGLHGVGASVTNALSRWLKATICREGKVYEIEFASVPDCKGNIKGGITQKPLTQVGTCPKDKSGTFIRFLPDTEIFQSHTFSADIIRKRLRELAFLNKGVQIDFVDEQEKTNISYKYDGGLKDFIAYLNETKTVIHDEPIYIEGENLESDDCLRLALAIQYTDGYNESIFSFVNNIATSEGGTHEIGLKSALTRVLNDIAKKHGYLKEKEANLMGEDFREGITCLLAIKMRNTQFEGQTKTKLGNPEAKTLVENIVTSELYKFFEKKEHAKVTELIINKAKSAARTRLAAKKAKEISRQKNSIENSSLIGKLAVCSGRKAEQNEIFIVEGDSAGGSAKQARDRSFQAILSLRGKPLNAEKKRLDQVLANEEIKLIIGALGTSIGEDFDIDNLKYHKVIILSDADQDGAHIRAILLTFFFRYMKELLVNGNVYIGLPPLYKISKKDAVEYVYSDKELPEAIKRMGKGYSIQRYKGLGEMNPDQLWETTMDPEKRSLLRVEVEDAANAERMITTLMGDNIEARKAYLNEYVNFNKEESNFEKLNG